MLTWKDLTKDDQVISEFVVSDGALRLIGTEITFSDGRRLHISPVRPESRGSATRRVEGEEI